MIDINALYNTAPNIDEWYIGKSYVLISDSQTSYSPSDLFTVLDDDMLVLGWFNFITGTLYIKSFADIDRSDIAQAIFDICHEFKVKSIIEF